MDPSNLSADADGDGSRRLQPSRTQLHIQGPRPTPLSIHKDSHKIKKSSKPPLPEPRKHIQREQPVVIYAVSPKVINVTVSDFMTTVQRLTGVSSENFSSDGDVSPAARLASVERAISPRERERSSCSTTAATDHIVVEEEGGVEVGRIPGILSPATLPPVVQEMYFSPIAAAATATTAADPFGFYGLHGNGGFFTSSPSGLSNLVGSPVFSPDFLSQIWNF